MTNLTHLSGIVELVRDEVLWVFVETNFVAWLYSLAKEVRYSLESTWCHGCLCLVLNCCGLVERGVVAVFGVTGWSLVSCGAAVGSSEVVGFGAWSLLEHSCGVWSLVAEVFGA
ncbi:hypothetical protein Droror1_Dr00012475 [Drosera rotundifolia]